MKTLVLILLGFACGLAVFAAWYWGVARQEQEQILFLEPPRSVTETPRDPANPSLGVEVVAGGGSPSHPLAGFSPSLLSDSPPADISKPGFQTETMKAWVKLHPNGPYKKIPETASQLEIDAFEREALVILADYQKEHDRLLAKHGDDLLALVDDPAAIQLEKDRNHRLKDLLLSIWPGTMP